jgi:hypothetical protein
LFYFISPHVVGTAKAGGGEATRKGATMVGAPRMQKELTECNHDREVSSDSIMLHDGASMVFEAQRTCNNREVPCDVKLHIIRYIRDLTLRFGCSRLGFGFRFWDFGENICPSILSRIPFNLASDLVRIDRDLRILIWILSGGGVIDFRA